MKSSELESLEEHEHIPLLVKTGKDDRKQVEYLRGVSTFMTPYFFV